MTKKKQTNMRTTQNESLLNDDEQIPHEQNTSASYTLSLFENLYSPESDIDKDKPITVETYKDTDTVGFRRGNMMISVSKLTVAQRRLMDVVFFIVSQKPDLNPAYEQYVIKKGTTYLVDFDLFRWLSALPSHRKNNYARIMRGMHTAEFNFQKELEEKDKQADHKRDFMYSVILASIGIVDKGERVKFTINPDFIEILENQHLYKDNHFLNLCFNMPNLSSKQLYDWLLVRMARQKESELDVKITVDEFREEVLLDKNIYPRFNDLNRHVIAAAVKGINEHSHYKTEIEQLRLASKSSQVTHLRIKAKTVNPVQEDNLNEPLELMIRLRIEFGLTKGDIEEILKNKTTWTDEYIDRATRYVMFYHKKRGVDSFRGYLMNSLRKGYVIGQGVGLFDEAAANEASSNAISFADMPIDLSAYPDVIKEVKEAFENHSKDAPALESNSQQELTLSAPSEAKKTQNEKELTVNQIAKTLTDFFKMSEDKKTKLLNNFMQLDEVIVFMYSDVERSDQWEKANDKEKILFIMRNERLKTLFIKIILDESSS